MKQSQLNRDLLWFYDQAEADCGISSSWNSLVSQAFHFNATGNVTEDKIASLMDSQPSPLKRLRRISKAFFRLPTRTRRMLEATYSFYNFPPEVQAIFGHKTGCAMFNTHLTNLEDLLNLCRKKLNHRMSEADEKQFFLIGMEVRKLFDQIHSEFVQSLQYITDNK